MTPALSLYLALTARPSQLGRRILRRFVRPPAPHDQPSVDDIPARPANDLIWFHVSSVSGALAIQELTRQLEEVDETIRFLITTGNGSVARAVQAHPLENAIYWPVPEDFGPGCRKFLDHWRPDLCVWTGSRLRPRLVVETHRKGIPLVMLNARMTQRRFGRLKFVRRMMGNLLGMFRVIHVQDPHSGNFFYRLGVPVERCIVTGTLRESSAALPYDETARESFAALVGRRAVWLAALTHKGEEAIVAQAHREVLRRAPRALMIIMPQSPARGAGIAKMYRDNGWRVARRAAGEPLLPDTEIYVADTADELGLWYRIAPISFVGGSMMDGTGHNPFEPAALGSAVVHGPNVDSYREVYDRLRDAGGARLVRDEGELASAVVDLLAPDQVATMAHAAWEVCSSGAATTDQAIEVIVDSIGLAA